MNRVAVFVDAGYLFAQGSALLTGQKRPRGEMEIDLVSAMAALEDLACRLSSVQLLRIYWYDGTATGPTPQHIAVAYQPRVKLRLGFVNTAGEQKGVDSLIVTDMITLARNRAMSDALLLSGDEDIRVGVQQAQEFGVRVHLLGITPCRGSQSQFLLQEADTTHEWTKAEISKFLTHKPKSPLTGRGTGERPTISTAGQEPSQTLSLKELAKQASEQISIEPSEIEALLASYDSSHQLPPAVDRPLLGLAKKKGGRLLTPEEREQLRALFIGILRETETGGRGE